MGQDAHVYAPTAEAFDRAPAENIQHNCPLCHKTFGWEEFQAHAKPCIDAHPDKVREIEERTD